MRIRLKYKKHGNKKFLLPPPDRVSCIHDKPLKQELNNETVQR